ncbi:ExbD/TolR family protein [Nitrosospira multiformis]|uniref:ExbD/TolR family protein n=1 Tax=Nitrosospira multiformis TaxID=1231 RepID=UPI000898F70C|nr:biopolymer transporter ExbD [Nitrosospira multiformis]SEA08946.1 biopolymer transport protein ExbD [Nitrosospira multiformis]
MNFQRGRNKEEPEINLVPMIDVLLVILIFLMITTTYSRFSELEITLPQTSSEKSGEQSNVIDISVSATGNYMINQMPIQFRNVVQLQEELRSAAGSRVDPVIVINADAQATHQSVITVMEAAQMAGYNRITFTTRNRE